MNGTWFFVYEDRDLTRCRSGGEYIPLDIETLRDVQIPLIATAEENAVKEEREKWLEIIAKHPPRDYGFTIIPRRPRVVYVVGLN